MKPIILWMIVLLFFAPVKTFAQSSFSVSPTNISASHSANFRQTISIQNLTDAELNLSHSFKTFYKTQGNISFTQPDSALSQRLTPFQVNPSEEYIVIPARETRQIQVSRDEADTSRDDLYMALVLSAEGNLFPDNTTGSQIHAGTAIPMIFSTPEPDSSLLLEEYSLPQLIFNNSLPITVRVKNISNSSTRTSGSVTIKSISGKTVDTIELEETLTFAQATERLSREESYSTKLLMGIYAATLNLTYDDTVINQTKYLIIFPKALIIPLVILCFIASGIYLRVKKYF